MRAFMPGLRTCAPSTLLIALALALSACGGSGGGGASPAPAPNPTPTPAPSPQPSGVAEPGLAARPSNATCQAWERPQTTGAVSLQRYAPALSFTRPIGLLQAPGDGSRWYVIEQDGLIRTFLAANPTTADTFADLRARVASVGDGAGNETGLLGLAFHPDFPTDPRVYLAYTAAEPLRLVVAEMRTAAGDAARLDPVTERVLLAIHQPQSNHNGGHLAFGPDGLLYIGVGDGGGAGDTGEGHAAIGNAQSLQTLLGKMVRIDVEPEAGGAPYRIPADNPYAGGARCNVNGGTSAEACAEIYASGFRNPWRWSFDRVDGALWVADVGQHMWEEVNQVTRGGNYGWRCREGAHNYNTTGCSMSGLTDPLAEYDHSEGASITGGYVYRGPQNSRFAGRYLFGDFGSGRIWAWIPGNTAQDREPTFVLDSGLSIASFGEGADGELYVVDYGGGLYRFNFGGVAGGAAPQNLSATGCVLPDEPSKPAPGLIPYDVNAPFWSDGAAKERWLALPDGQSLTVQSDGDLDAPPGAVLMKHFRLNERLIETRLFMRHPDGAWGGYSYAWNEAQTDAVLVPGGATRDLGAQSWVFPSEGQCLECHTSAAGRSLGLEIAQLNGEFAYPLRNAHQLVTLNHIGVLNPPLQNPTQQAQWVDPSDAAADLTARARAYLHTNCSQCHRPGGPTSSDMDLRASTPLNATHACNAAPTFGDAGLGDQARVIAPGDASRSVLVNRMNRRDAQAMPPLGSLTVDTVGVQLIAQWIDSLPGC